MSIVESRRGTTRIGGVTGKGFTPGVSGNPGGRPKGLSRRVRELGGEDGEAIAKYMLSVMNDERARTADRIEAGKWLANRGFGTAPLVIEAGVTPEQSVAGLLQQVLARGSASDAGDPAGSTHRSSAELAESKEQSKFEEVASSSPL